MKFHPSVITFLLKCKKNISKGNWLIVQRRADYAHITEMNATEIKRVLLALTPDNFVDGPLKDRDPRRKGKVWIFKFIKESDSIRNIYIKMKLTHNNKGNDITKVISFHYFIHVDYR